MFGSMPNQTKAKCMKLFEVSRFVSLGAVAAMLVAAIPAQAQPDPNSPPPYSQPAKPGKPQGPVQQHAPAKPQGPAKQPAPAPHYNYNKQPAPVQQHKPQPPAKPQAGKAPDYAYWNNRPIKWDRSHRDVIVRYYSTHKASCPPGLLKTSKGCLPKGQSKKRYVVGKTLPRSVVIETLPNDLYRQLPPPPRGHIYRRVDGDVLLIVEATRKVVDAVVLFPSR